MDVVVAQMEGPDFFGYCDFLKETKLKQRKQLVAPILTSNEFVLFFFLFLEV